MYQITDYDDCVFDGGLSANISPSNEPFPNTYLAFAKDDLKINSVKGRVNACTNAKRAIHFQIDIFYAAYGAKKSRNRRNLSFPQKLDFCSKCGIIAPQVLNRLNRLRNTIEHDYYLPTEEETRDFVEIAELFLLATERFITNFPSRLMLRSKNEEEFADQPRRRLFIDFLPYEGTIEIKINTCNAGSKLIQEEFEKLYKAKQEDPFFNPNAFISLEFIKQFRSGTYRDVIEKFGQKENFVIRIEQDQAYLECVSFIASKTEGHRGGDEYRDFAWKREY